MQAKPRQQEFERNGMRDIICIAGPTASGKTGFGIEIAKSVDGEIINADALQVYADLSILSARPTEAEKAGIPHHLFGHVQGDTAYSVGQWQREAVPTILDILARQKTPILVGGTGLYFKSLLVGLANIPEVPADRAEDLAHWSVDDLRAEAERLDPVAAKRVLGADPQRLQRIIGVTLETGRPLSVWQQDTRPVIPERFVRKAVLMPDRGLLYDRINQRFETMIAAGALEEARRVYRAEYGLRAPMLKAIGLSHLLSYLEAGGDLEKTVDTAKRDTRRLAKRQSTWFRNQCGDWPKLTREAEKTAFLRLL